MPVTPIDVTHPTAGDPTDDVAYGVLAQLQVIKAKLNSLITSHNGLETAVGATPGISAIAEQLYDVGSFWTTSSTVDAATYWGFGTWVKRTGVLYGHAPAHPKFGTLGAAGSSGTGASIAFSTLMVSTTGASTMVVNDITNPHDHPLVEGRVVNIWERTA